MEIHKNDVVELSDSGKLGRVCSVEDGGYWIYLVHGGCLFVPLGSLKPGSGDVPECPDTCPPD